MYSFDSGTLGGHARNLLVIAKEIHTNKPYYKITRKELAENYGTSCGVVSAAFDCGNFENEFVKNSVQVMNKKAILEAFCHDKDTLLKYCDLDSAKKYIIEYIEEFKVD